jgi:hypothetical protein
MAPSDANRPPPTLTPSHDLATLRPCWRRLPRKTSAPVFGNFVRFLSACSPAVSQSTIARGNRTDTHTSSGWGLRPVPRLTPRLPFNDCIVWQ